MIVYKKELMWFQKAMSNDMVTVNYSITIDTIGTLYKDVILSDIALCELAASKNKTTWDEQDICEMLELDYPQSPL